MVIIVHMLEYHLHKEIFFFFFFKGLWKEEEKSGQVQLLKNLLLIIYRWEKHKSTPCQKIIIS